MIWISKDVLSEPSASLFEDFLTLTADSQRAVQQSNTQIHLQIGLMEHFKIHF